MQNCWIFASWPCIAARLAARLFIESWVAVYAAPKFDIVSAVLYDPQADVDDVMISHGVSCGACVRCADEKTRCKGLETFGRMLLGGLLLLICFAVFARGLTVLFHEPIEHVQEDCVGVFHSYWFVGFSNHLREIRKEDIGQGQIHGYDVCSCFLVAGVGSFQALTLVVRSASGEVWDGVNFGRKRKIICWVGFVCEEQIETW